MQEIEFDPNYLAPFDEFRNIQKGTVICMGGRGGGKTINVSKFVITRLLTKPNARGILIRDEKTKIKESILNDVKSIAREYDEKTDGDFSKRFEIQNFGIKNLKNGEDAVFVLGLRDSTSGKTAAQKGLSKIDFVILEEAEDIKDEDVVRRLMDTITRFPDAVVFFLLNTPPKNHWIIKRYFKLEKSEYEGFYVPIPARDDVKYFFTTYKDNPKLALDAVKRYESYADPKSKEFDLDYFCNQILGLVPEMDTSLTVCKNVNNLSWRDTADKPYTINHSWIRQQLSLDGYYFLAFDGGAHTTHSAGFLGYHVTDYQRDICLKEFYNHAQHEGLPEISKEIKEFCEHHDIDYSEAQAYGDPTIFLSGNDPDIADELDIKVNYLEHFQNPENKQFKGLFVNRKEKRLGRINTEASAIRSDNKPAIIILRGEDKVILDKTPEGFYETKLVKGETIPIKLSEKLSFGCPNFYKGLFDGEYRREQIEFQGKKEPGKELEQIAPITDICDAYTYYLLATRPFTIKDMSEDKDKQRRLDARAASSGW